MSTHQVKVSERDEKGKNKEVVTKVTDDKNTETKHKTVKSGGEHEAVLADVNNDSKKVTK
ncbi:hypothetical protein [Nitrincola iocasae]|uniref:Uncharacterized protein n=1 Tax=Nitrincola iocasae TaxID=2614693 RepID=A0A5J6LFY9_9GAMM|nr:hypothetical protein [Nitrincola iocasae]QEW07519.1 hypothetical protein F5I99_14010 [Nitrincola iocasae]